MRAVSRTDHTAALDVAMILALLLLMPLQGFAGQGPAGKGLALQSLDGPSVDPFAGNHLATAFVFVHADCPVSSRYVPELNHLHDEYASHAVRLWLVYPGREHDEAVIRAHYSEYGLRVPALRDPEFQLADVVGATITPEAVVFAPERRLVYRGRIDDRAVRLGVWRATPSTRDLAGVLERLVRGEAIIPFTTQAVGCYVRPLFQ